MRAKIIVAAIVLVASVSYLTVAGVKKGWVYYMSVDQFAADAGTSRVRLHGQVGADRFLADRAALTAQFVLKGSQHELGVTYRGVIPDLFEPGKEVVIEGSRDAAGNFQADVLMTKCASKYEKDGMPNAVATE